jgi:hypothetical protein
MAEEVSLGKGGVCKEGTMAQRQEERRLKHNEAQKK